MKANLSYLTGRFKRRSAHQRQRSIEHSCTGPRAWRGGVITSHVRCPLPSTSSPALHPPIQPRKVMRLLGRDQVAYMMSDIYTLSIMCIQCTYVTIINGGMHGHATIRWLL